MKIETNAIKTMKIEEIKKEASLVSGAAVVVSAQ